MAPEPARKNAPPPRTGMPPWMVALFIAILLGGGAWMIMGMREQSSIQDCVMSGRKNCVVYPEYGR